MGSLFTILQGIVMVFIIFSAHSVVAYVSPWPLYMLNIIYLYLIHLMIGNHKNKALWLALVFGYMTELFSAELFGIHMITLLASVGIVGWLMQAVFTNHSWYIIAVVGLTATLIYRTLYLALVFASRLFMTTEGELISVYLFDSVITEVAVNMIGLMIVYTAANIFSKKRNNPRYV